MRYVSAILGIAFLVVGVGVKGAGDVVGSTTQTIIGYVILAVGIALAFMAVCWPSKNRGKLD
jgi:hypothetical protein